MTNRQLLDTILQSMNNEELADFLLKEDLKNVVVFDNSLKGESIKEKMVEFLNKKVEE